MSHWCDLYQAVLLGAEFPDLEKRIALAEHAIEVRLRQLNQGDIHEKEQTQICEAIQTLKLLRLQLEESKRKAR